MINIAACLTEHWDVQCWCSVVVTQALVHHRSVAVSNLDHESEAPSRLHVAHRYSESGQCTPSRRQIDRRVVGRDSNENSAGRHVTQIRGHFRRVVWRKTRVKTARFLECTVERVNLENVDTAEIGKRSEITSISPKIHHDHFCVWKREKQNVSAKIHKKVMTGFPHLNWYIAEIHNHPRCGKIAWAV